MMIKTMFYDSPIGRLLLAEENQALIGVWIQKQKYYPNALLHHMKPCGDSLILQQTITWLKHYFQGEQPSIHELTFSLKGSDFQKEVWNILCEIPYGQTMTYGEISKRMAKKRGLDHMSAQAVGGAVGHNPISIIVPCHRVVGTTGCLVGYAGGIDKKMWLLAHEGVDLNNFSIPQKGTAL